MSTEDLVAAVERASTELDTNTVGRLICVVQGVQFGHVAIYCGDDGSDELVVRGMNDEWVWSQYRHLAPDLSVDTALELIGARLPGWFWTISAGGEHPAGPYWAELYRHPLGFDTQGEPIQYGGKTPALALCNALLRTIHQQGQDQ